MKIIIKNLTEKTLQDIIVRIGSLSIAECAIQETDCFNVELNPDITEIFILREGFIHIRRMDTGEVIDLNPMSFEEVVIC